MELTNGIIDVIDRQNEMELYRLKYYIKDIETQIKGIETIGTDKEEEEINITLLNNIKQIDKLILNNIVIID